MAVGEMKDKFNLVVVVIVAVASTYIGIRNLRWFTRYLACNWVTIAVQQDVCQRSPSKSQFSV